MTSAYRSHPIRRGGTYEYRSSSTSGGGAMVAVGSGTAGRRSGRSAAAPTS
jgi:hypothetical protein